MGAELPVVMCAPSLGASAQATAAAALAFVAHVRALRIQEDHAAADGATAHLCSRALDTVLLKVPDARVIAAVARSV
jgi:hypothetical protein